MTRTVDLQDKHHSLANVFLVLQIREVLLEKVDGFPEDCVDNLVSVLFK